MERYANLYRLLPNQYMEGCPVIVSAGALLKDNETGKVIAQLKIKNIQDRVIKALKVNIKAFDTAGEELDSVDEYEYMDLNIHRDEEFGSKAPIILPNSATRRFSAEISQIVFDDGDIWRQSGKAYTNIEPQDNANGHFCDSEMEKQYKILFGDNANFIYYNQSDLWFCACGAVNSNEEQVCHSCKLNREDLEGFCEENLKEEKNRRVDKEQKESSSKKKRIIVVAAIGLAIIAVLSIFFTSKSKKEAAAIAEAQYNEAIAIAEAQYNEAIAIAENYYSEGNYHKAALEYAEIGDIEGLKKAVRAYGIESCSGTIIIYSNGIGVIHPSSVECVGPKGWVSLGTDDKDFALRFLNGMSLGTVVKEIQN